MSAGVGVGVDGEGGVAPVAPRGRWSLRGRRFATGTHVSVSILLAVLVVGMANYIVYRRAETRWDVSSYKYYHLSEKTRLLLGAIKGQVRVVTLLRPGSALADEVDHLLREYQYAATGLKALTFEVRVLDPSTDLAAIRDVVREFAVTDEEVIVFSFEGRHRIVSATELEEYDRMVVPDATAAGGLSISRTKTAFRGEQVFSSAIHSLTQAARPAVYFLAGHGERDIESFGAPEGYGRMATLIRRDNVDVRRLLLAEAGKVPVDAAALVLAGPTLTWSVMEREVLARYLEGGGRLLVLTDPQHETGLEPLLATWGVRLDRDLVVGMTLTGRELFVKDYGRHAITRPLRDAFVVFYGVRSVEPAGKDDGLGGTDRPTVESLLMTTENSWAERSMEGGVPRFDAGVDRPGPISVGVAVERGGSQGLTTALRPTRLVVFGDSDFLSNGALQDGVAGNTDLLMNAVNWLLERDALMAIAPRPARLIQPGMSEAEVRWAYVVLVVFMPLVAVMLGLWVWERRRRS